MKIQSVANICLFTFSLFAMSCKGPAGPAGPEGPSGPKLKGDITGLVLLVDENGSQPSDRSGVNVAIEGTSFTTTTDVSGSYILSGLETGVYTITYSKTGYGISKIIKYQFIGGGQIFLGTISLCQPPPYYVTNLTNTSGTTITKTLSSPISAARSVIYFIGKSSSVSSHPSNYLNYLWYTGLNFTNGVYTLSLSASSLRSAGFVSGSTAYIVAYGANEGGRSSGYTDVTTGRYVYTNISSTASNVIAITVP